MTDKIAAIVDAFYGMSDTNRKKALMRVLGEISGSKPDRERSFEGGG